MVDTLSTSEDNGEANRQPRSRVETQELPRVQGTQPSKTLSDSPEIKKVTLIEDNPVDARLISRMLQKSRPLEIRQIQRGQEAIKTIRKEKPDLLILDLLIPDKNGFQILEELKQDEELDTIPVVVITAKDLSEDERQLLISSGVSSMWQKGNLDRERLIAHIDAQLE